MMDVIIIGAGASGMMAAITAARTGASVLVLEHTDTIGKKILATGNGKCNFTNMVQGGAYYHGGDPAFVLPALSAFGAKDAIDFFEDLGIRSKARDGYLHPACGQASAVRDSLIYEMERLQIVVETGVGIRSIEAVKNEKDYYFLIHTKNGDYVGKTCILACGGKASKKTGSDGSGYIYAKQLGHKITPVYPALTAIQTEKTDLQKLASGVRCFGKITIQDQTMQKATYEVINAAHEVCDTGELQITDYGISGIPAFQVSRYVAAWLGEEKQVTVTLDFLPEYEWAETEQMLLQRLERFCTGTLEQACIGLLNGKLMEAVLHSCHLSKDMKLRTVNKKALVKRLLPALKQYQLTPTGVKSFDHAQVCAGGADVSQIDSDTMESLLVPGLYFAGEILDVDGMCGGYNLQWAWSSGYVAGSHAAKQA